MWGGGGGRLGYQLRFRWVGDRCPSRHLFEIGRHVLLILVKYTRYLVCLCCRLLGPHACVHQNLGK